MTDKRFTVKKDCIVDNTDGGYYTADKQDLNNLCELLNELHEENERLRRCINTIYTIARLEEV